MPAKKLRTAPALPPISASLPASGSPPSQSWQKVPTIRERLAAWIAVKTVARASGKPRLATVRWPEDARIEVEKWLLAPREHWLDAVRQITRLAIIAVLYSLCINAAWPRLSLIGRVACISYIWLCVAEQVPPQRSSPADSLLAGLGAFVLVALCMDAFSSRGTWACEPCPS